MMRTFDTPPQPAGNRTRRGQIAAAVLLIASIISVPVQSRPAATDAAAAVQDSALVRSLGDEE